MKLINNTDIKTQTIAETLADMCEDLQVLPIDETSFEVFNAEDLVDDSGATEHTPVDADRLVDILYEMTDSPEFNDMDPCIDGNAIVIDSLCDRYNYEFETQIAAGNKLYMAIRDFLMRFDGFCVQQTFTAQSLGMDAFEFENYTGEDFQTLLERGLHAYGMYAMDAWKGWGIYTSAEITGEWEVTFQVWENC